MSDILDTPALSLPFRMEGDAVACHEQDTEEDYLQNAATVIRYTQGERDADPLFGIPDPILVEGGLPADSIITAVRRYEPEVAVTVIKDAMDVVAETGVEEATVNLEVSQNG